MMEMNSSTKLRIRSMLSDAYPCLGITGTKEIETRIQEAMEYLARDREHFIEAADADVPEYCITIHNGVICKLIPLAREIIRDQEKDHVREHTAVLSLMVAEEDIRYVYGYSYARLYPDRERNGYSFPVYRYADLADIRKELQVLSPEQIRPAATKQDWEIFGMMFAAFDRFVWDQHINTVPHKTERAMMTVQYALPEKLQADGSEVTGKVIPLAEGDTVEQLREDHRYSYTDALCLLIDQNAPRYLMKTRHVYRYFRKVIYDDVPGGCSYEPTEEKQEITYRFVTLEDIRQDMYSLYY